MESEDREIISLGNNCDVGLALRKLKLKQQTYPFDWVRSNPKIIYDTLVNGYEKYIQFGNPDGNNYNVSDDYQIKDMFACFYKGKKQIPNSHINYYGQHFTHYIDLPSEELKAKFSRYFNRFLDILESSNIVIFIHTTENYILHKLSRDNKDLYFSYLKKIAEFIAEKYPKLNFKILNLEHNNPYQDTSHIINYNMTYNLPYSDYFENHTPRYLIPYRKEIERILREVL